MSTEAQRRWGKRDFGGRPPNIPIIPENTASLVELAVARRKIAGQTTEEIAAALNMKPYAVKGALQYLRKRWGLPDMATLLSDERLISQLGEKE